MNKRSPGRPRSEDTRLAILRAARDLILESGYENLAIQAIAVRAGCGRQTIYRWWSSRALILADLIVEGHLPQPGGSVPDSGELASDLTEWLDAASASLADPARTSILLALVTAASENADEARRLYDTTTGPLRRKLARRLETAKRRGQLSGHLDPEALSDALIGVFLLRVLTPRTTHSSSEAMVKTLIG